MPFTSGEDAANFSLTEHKRNRDAVQKLRDTGRGEEADRLVYVARRCHHDGAMTQPIACVGAQIRGDGSCAKVVGLRQTLCSGRGVVCGPEVAARRCTNGGRRGGGWLHGVNVCRDRKKTHTHAHMALSPLLFV